VLAILRDPTTESSRAGLNKLKVLSAVTYSTQFTYCLACFFTPLAHSIHNQTLLPYITVGVSHPNHNRVTYEE